MNELLTAGAATIATQEYDGSTRYGYFMGDESGFITVVTIHPEGARRIQIHGSITFTEDLPLISIILAIVQAETRP